MQLFINNWSAVLTAPATASAVSLSVPLADAAKLIGLGTGDHYLLTLAEVDGNGLETAWEIVKVTGAASGALTVLRAQEGTVARDWAAASAISGRATKGTLEALQLSGTAVGDADPQPLGDAAPGGAATASREDHVHAMPTAADIGAATAAQGAKADTAVQPAALASALDSKVDVDGAKVLSDENYTSAEKAKLAGLEAAHFKGLHASLAALQAAHPSAAAGDYADVDSGVGADVARYIWDTSDSAWIIQSGASGGMTAAQIKTAYESNPDTNVFSDTEQAKLAAIASGATANATDAELRDRSTHTGSQAASTISDFAATVRATVLTGLSLASGAAITAADSALAALGKLQKQITDLVDAVGGKQDSLVSGTNLKTVNGSSLLGAGDLAIAGGGAALPVIRAITANETLALANINTFGVNSTVSNYTSTIPAQATVAWTADAEMHFLPSNTGDITITAAAGVSLNGVVAGSLTLSMQNGAASLKRTGANTWWLGGAIGGSREVLDAPRTYYVRTDGSDSNNGLTNTSGGAFLTIQKAVDVAARLDLGGYDVTVRCTGSFTATVTLKTLVGAGSVEIRGGASNTTDFSVTVAGGDCFSFGSGFLGLYKLHYVKLSTTISGRCVGGSGGGGAVNYGNIDFGACAAMHISVSQGQYCAVDGPITISGPAGSHIQALAGGYVRENNTTVTITGTPAFTQFASAGRSGTLIMSGNTYVGAATGSRYNATLNGVIFVNGAGATYLPGDTDGVTATGGQYA